MGDTNQAVENLIVNKDTGEIVDSVMVGDRLNITRKNKIEFLEDTISIPFKKFTKLNSEEITLLAQELNKTDFAFLVSLSDYVGYYDNCLKNRRGEPMSISEIACRLNLSRSAAYRSVEHLMKLNILCKARTSEFQLFVCPLLFVKGNRTNRVLQTMFRNYQVRSCNNMKWEKLLKREV